MKKFLPLIAIGMAVAFAVAAVAVSQTTGCTYASAWFQTIYTATLDDCGSGVDFAATVYTHNVFPDGHNTRQLGATNAKWSDVQSVLIQGADVGFANGWKFREFPLSAKDVARPNDWMKKHANEGVQLLDDQDNLIAVFHRNGYLYTAGTRPLETLPK